MDFAAKSGRERLTAGHESKGPLRSHESIVIVPELDAATAAGDADWRVCSFIWSRDGRETRGMRGYGAASTIPMKREPMPSTSER